jgi:hypothetical protein
MCSGVQKETVGRQQDTPEPRGLIRDFSRVALGDVQIWAKPSKYLDDLFSRPG